MLGPTTSPVFTITQHHHLIRVARCPNSSLNRTENQKQEQRGCIECITTNPRVRGSPQSQRTSPESEGLPRVRGPLQIQRVSPESEDLSRFRGSPKSQRVSQESEGL